MRRDLAALACAARHLGGGWAALAAAVATSVLFVVVPMQAAVLTGALVDGLHGRQARLYGVVRLPAASADVLVVTMVGLVAVALASGALAYARTAMVAAVSRRFVAQLRVSLIRRLETLSVADHHAWGVSELLNVLVVDADTMQRFLEKTAIQMPADVARVLYPVVMLFAIDARLALVAVAIVPLQWGVGRYLQRGLHAASRKARATRRALTVASKETLDGIETVRTADAHAHFAAIMTGLTSRLEREELAAQRQSARLSGVVWTLTSLGLALTWWRGGALVLAGGMTLGTLVAFTAFLAFVYAPSRRFTALATEYHRGLVALERIREVLETGTVVTDAAGAADLALVSGRVEVRDVCFSYGGRPILGDVDLMIRPREITAITGPSGGGKSSLLKLLARLHEPTRGRVLIDGQDIAGVGLASLRAQVAVVPQHPVIFSGTVLDNLRLGRDVPPAEIVAACEAADAATFIGRLEHGLQTMLGEGGASLSGGERQRLALARALLRKPAILLLDEPSSAVDPASEAAILAALRRLRAHTTVVVVAHGEAAIRAADRVVRLEEGTIVDDGMATARVSCEPGRRQGELRV
jgi:ATP-binding cassette subfamily B protein